MCIGGLSDQSRFLHAHAQTPHDASSPEQISALFGSYLGGPVTTE